MQKLRNNETLIAGNRSRDRPPCTAGTEITTKLLLPLLLLLLLLMLMMTPMLRLTTNPRHINIVLSGVAEYLSSVSISFCLNLQKSPLEMLSV